MVETFLHYEAVEQAPLQMRPCPHLVVPDFLRREALSRLIPLFPSIRAGGSFAPESLSIQPEFSQFLEEFQGVRLKTLIGRKFGLDLENAPSMLTLRGQTREKDGRIHLDSDSKRVTILLYMNDPWRDWSAHGGCLRFTNGPDDINDYAAEIPPVGGTLVVFPNHPASWHGHLPYCGPRCTIQLNYMAKGWRTSLEQKRHKISAFWKKLKP
ncbi:2OG-Fe(II) oxygenase [Acetobacteraceae bacterium ESL0709]|nr:2OG-Fe(II) oxygenase [Acetobacteraceae bacterium ESL0697]MDF7678834.1 2OG-Fe(II) oxygenase [Acetobacteraceae bacterium ESL0709]